MKKIIYVVLAAILMLTNACEDIVEIKLSVEDVNLYAVEAKITTTNNPYVFVYKTQRVNSTEPYSGISKATVTISDNSSPSKTIQLVESTYTPGLYIPNGKEVYLGKPGKEYTVTILTNGKEISATEPLSEVVSIDSIHVRSSLRGDNRFLGVFTYGNETPGIGNYYKWDIYVNNKLINIAGFVVIASDELVDGKYIRGLEIYTDFHDPKKPEDRLINLGDTIQVKQTSISKFAYYYYYQMLNQSQSGNMFSVPPANIKSNFIASDGSTVVGLFTANDISDSNKIIIDETIENQLKK